jgi:hypothetical protein
LKIVALAYDVYSSRWIHEYRCIRQPAWADIETAIRRLDRFHYPSATLRLLEDVTDDQQLEVMGGEGVYWVAASIEGYTQRRLVNPAGGSQEIAVWTSDQGFADEERFISRDLELVLRVARHFAMHAAFDPAAPWE